MYPLSVAKSLLIIAQEILELTVEATLPTPKMLSVPGFDPFPKGGEDSSNDILEKLLRIPHKDVEVDPLSESYHNIVNNLNGICESIGNQWEKFGEHLLFVTKKDANFFGPNYERESKIVNAILKHFLLDLGSLKNMIHNPNTIKAGKEDVAKLLLSLDRIKKRLDTDGDLTKLIVEFVNSHVKNKDKKHDLTVIFEGLRDMTDQLVDLLKKTTFPSSVVY